MAEKTPITQGTTNFLPTDILPIPDVVNGDVSESGRDGTIHLQGLTLRSRYFSNLDNGDTWTSGIPNPCVALWIGATQAANAGIGMVHVSNRSTGEITFTSESDNKQGYIVVGSKG